MDLIKLSYDSPLGLLVTIHPVLTALSILAVIVTIALKWQLFKRGYHEFEINEAEIGISDAKSFQGMQNWKQICSKSIRF